jgi:hypothetical protein
MRWKGGEAAVSSESLVPISLHGITSQKTVIFTATAVRILNRYYRLPRQYNDKVFVSMERVTLLGLPTVMPRARELKHTPLIREYVYCSPMIDTAISATLNVTKQ